MSTYSFNGLGMSLGNLARLSDAQTRSISAENFSGAKGEGGKATEGTGAVPARELGQGWKVSPSINIQGRTLCTLADIHGPGAIQHIWLTVHPQHWRRLVLRMFWDNEPTPSVEVPLGDFFCNGWGVRCNISSLPVAVNPAGGFNSYWEMPFKERALITLENLGPDKIEGFYYQIDHTLTEIEPDRAYFHTQWRRSNPLPYQTVHTILDGLYQSQQRFGMYRWHVMDPIRFHQDLRVTIQALGWRSTLEGQRRYLPLQDDIASTAFWYQTEPHADLPVLPDLNFLEVV